MPRLNLQTSSTEFGIQGQMQGRDLRFSRYVTGSGRAKQTWAELAVATHANQFTFYLTPENIFTKIGGLLGNHEIKIGDAEFDRHWRIKTNDASTLEMVLLPEMRKKIDQSPIKFGDFTLENDWIRYRASGDFSNAQIVARLESMIVLMCNLAEAIEVTVEKFSPPRLNSP